MKQKRVMNRVAACFSLTKVRMWSMFSMQCHDETKKFRQDSFETCPKLEPTIFESLDTFDSFEQRKSLKEVNEQAGQACQTLGHMFSQRTQNHGKSIKSLLGVEARS